MQGAAAGFENFLEIFPRSGTRLSRQESCGLEGMEVPAAKIRRFIRDNGNIRLKIRRPSDPKEIAHLAEPRKPTMASASPLVFGVDSLRFH